jgi:predicted exporter
MRFRATLWGLLLAVMAAFTLLRLASGPALETDLLAMLPRSARNPMADRAVATLAHTVQDRVILLVRGQDPDASAAAARDLARHLQDSGAFRNVQCDLPEVDTAEPVRFYTPYRTRLAPPDLPPGVTGRDLGPLVQARLASPGMGALSPAQDPFGSLNAFLGRLPLQSSGVELRDGLLCVPSPEGLHILVTAEPQGSPFDPTVQDRVLRAVDSAGRAAAAKGPLEVLRTGSVFYAADARRSMEREVNLISLLSVVAIFGLYFLIFRSPRHLLLGLASAASGLVVGTAVCLALFGRLHLLTLVCGTTVLGVSVDYSFLYFAHHLDAGEAWDPLADLRRIRPALLLALATTLLGYAALLAAPFPGMRQIAVFSMAGLGGAFGTVVCLVPAGLRRPAAARPAILARMDRLLAAVRGAGSPRALVAALVAAALFLGGALALARPDDDVHGLIQPSAALRHDEARIQGLLKIASGGAFILVEGSGEAEVLQREEALLDRLPVGRLETAMALSRFVPSPARQEANLAENRRLTPLLLQGLEDAGFRPESARQALGDAAAPPLTLDAFLGTTFAIPCRPLRLAPTASIVLPLGGADAADLHRACAGLPGVTVVDKAGEVSGMLARYRRLATGALVTASLLVGLLLSARHGLAWGFRLLVPPLTGMAAGLFLTSALGFPVTLFTVLALILALGFGVDYAIFIREGGLRPRADLLGVCLASYATLVSFGLLALSSTPALRSFGLVLATAVLVSALLSILALPTRETP